VDVPGTVEPALRYEWKVDGRPVTGRELFEFKNQTPGTHEVEVTTTGPSGATIAPKWTVEVQEEQTMADRAPVWAPYLKLFDLENEISADKKQVIIRGKVENVDERNADNVVVWVTALNPQGQTVTRRLALPSPQPLAPGQTATFQVALSNREDAADFHFELVSK
jgi:hypothetical protein